MKIAPEQVVELNQRIVQAAKQVFGGNLNLVDPVLYRPLVPMPPGADSATVMVRIIVSDHLNMDGEDAAVLADKPVADIPEIR